MIPDNYYYSNELHDGDLTSYEEHLLLSYDNYLENPITGPTDSHNHYALKLDDINDELDDDMDSEYDENDWDEEDLDDDLIEHYDENDRDVDTFSDDSYKID